MARLGEIKSPGGQRSDDASSHSLTRCEVSVTLLSLLN